MPNNRDEIEIRSDEIQEMLGRTPNWTTMWGASVILLLILLLLALGWFISYPNLVSGKVLITTSVPPARLETTSAGTIRELFAHNFQSVDQGEILAEIESNNLELIEILEVEKVLTIPELSILKQKLISGNVIRSPIKGTVVYTEPITQNQYFSKGQALFLIVPDTESYVGIIRLSSEESVRIKIGQLVRIALDEYPVGEYGNLLGEVSEISAYPMTNNEGTNHIVTVRLEKGLLTTKNVKLEFSTTLEGSADIVTEDLRILDRIFYNLRKLTRT